MWWWRDDIVDELIANNAARPIPSMEKPDMSKFVMLGQDEGAHGGKAKRQGSILGPPQGASRPSPDVVHERLGVGSL